MAQARVLGTNHTSFTVRSLDRTLAFFRDALGFEVTSRAPRDPAVIEGITGVSGARVEIAYARGAGHAVELIEYSGPDDRAVMKPRPCDIGFAHIAYDVADIDEAVAAAAPHGFMPIKPPYRVDKGPNAGGRAVYLRDPDGIAIEFIEPPKR
jgi:catechol 2,3-dioxygenase-like lactoylglutathione lyase family enzyme